MSDERQQLVARAERLRQQRKDAPRAQRIADLVAAVQATGRRRSAPVVYCVFAGDFMKIGLSSRLGLASRLGDIQVGCPHPIVLAGVAFGERCDEEELHRLLRPLRVGGEWFLIPPEWSTALECFATDASQWREMVTDRLRRKRSTSPLFVTELKT